MAQRYKKLKIKGRTVNAHRHKMEQHLGHPLDRSVVVHHKNEDRFDNDLSNLEVVTHKEHARLHLTKHPEIKRCEHCGAEYRPHATKRSRSKSCSEPCRRALQTKRRRARSDVIRPLAKLTEAAVADVRRRYVPGRGGNARQLAEELGVHISTIHSIAAGKTWVAPAVESLQASEAP